MNSIEISTKDKIIQAAIKLFSKRGFTETTVREIANTVGIKASSIYNHFESKDDILIEILNIYLRHRQTYISTSKAKQIDTANITAANLAKHMFYKFPTDDKYDYLSITRLIHAEYFRNEYVCEFLKRYMISDSYEFIKSTLNFLVEQGIIECNCSLAASIIYSVLFSYTSFYILDMPTIEPNTKTDMFSILESILQTALDGGFK